ncbi:MAG TPA: hypothetical protein VEZ20_04250 [Allosphingosinicella sp.]|nr:hypothetical protein [Allosphingosinicella sp.]
MTAYPQPFRARMLFGCALAVLAAAGLEQKAEAQGFTAMPTTQAGSVTYDRTTPGLDVITVNSPSAIIDWRFFNESAPTDPVVFLPAGNTGIFQSLSGGGEFAVLNRIFPGGASRVRMDGTVIGRLQTASGNVPGGTIAFYSPGGLIIGSSAVFDVGRLLLTTLNPAVDASGNFFTGGTLQLSSGGQFAPGSIVTEPGARLNALAEGSWIAMVAPRIEHGGAVRVNGSAAFVAAEAVTLRIDQGLFDIDIEVGTGDLAPIVHTGSTGGPASGGAGDNHVVYLAAAPRDNPITLLLAGSAGFDPAVSASVENGAIVLSAGHDVQGLAISEAPEGSPSADAVIRSGTYTSDLFGRASRDFLVGDSAPGGVTFQQDLSIAARRNAQLVADEGYVLRIGGNASVSAANLTPVAPDPGTVDIVGGDAAIFAAGGGTIAIAGNASVDASARGAFGDLGVGSGTGGRASVRSDGGTVTVGAGLAVRTDGLGGLGARGLPGDAGGAGTGGSAEAAALNGGTIRVGGTADLSASGIASASNGSSSAAGADGRGGNAFVAASEDGAIAIAGASTVAASGTGGGTPNGAAPGGTGTGGFASLSAFGGTVDSAGGAAVSADGSGGVGGSGGAGTGGDARIEAASGRVSAAGALAVRANGFGGKPSADAGGDGTGGSAGILGRAGGAEGLIGAGSMSVEASGFGGDAFAARGGDGRGGTAEATADARNGRLQSGAVSVQASGAGGTGGSARGGDGFGGAAIAGTIAPPLDVDAVSTGFAGRAGFGATTLAASGTGGAGAAGGTGAGGAVTLVSTSGPTTVTGQATLAANGTGGLGSGGARGLAQGGDLLVTAIPADGGPAGTLSATALSGRADALGDASSLNVMGRWRFAATGGSAINLGSANVGASATGTPASVSSEFQLDGGTVSVAAAGVFTTDGSIALSATGAGRLVGGDIALNGRTAVTLTHSGRPAGAQTVDADRFAAATAGTYAAEPGTAVLGRSGVTIAAGADALLLGATASLGTVAVSAGNDVRVAAPVTGGAAALAAGRDVVIEGTGSVDAGAGPVSVAAGRDYSAAAGSAVRGGDADLRAGRDALLGRTQASGRLAVTASGDIRVPAALTGAAIQLTAGQDAIVDGSGSLDAGAGAIQVAAGRDYSAAPASAVLGGDVDLSAGRDAALGRTDAAGRLSVAAGATARFAAAATGREVRVSSSDIDVTSAGSIGNAATDLVALEVRPNGQATTLGGAGAGPGYTLTQSEANRVRGDTVRVTALSAANGVSPSTQIVVRDLTLAGSTAAAGIDRFEVATPGNVRVDGALLLANAAAGDGIGLAAGRLEVATEAGSVRVRDGAGAPAGSIDIAAGDIWVADAPTLALLAADPNFAGRDETLRTNDGADRPRGQMEANAVRLAPLRTLYVRNSGTAAAFAGITVGPGGLVIDPSGNAPASVYAFGRRLNADGSVTANIPFFRAVDYSRGSSAGYTNESEFNGCIINFFFCGGAFVPAPDYPPGLFRVPPLQPAGDPLEPLDFLAEPLIEEPVTSGADSTLWIGPDDDDEEDEEEERP